MQILIPSFVKTLLSNGLVKAKIMKWLRWASNAAGVATLAWVVSFLTNNVHFLNQASDLAIAGVVATAVAGLILSIGSGILSQFDADTVHAKLQVVAMTGDAKDANNKDLVSQVKAANNDNDQVALAALASKLQAGKL